MIENMEAEVGMYCIIIEWRVFVDFKGQDIKNIGI